MAKANEFILNVVKAWEEAASDLGLEIKAPFCLHNVEYTLLVKYFGSPKGTLIQLLDDAFDTENGDLAQKNSYYLSCINPVHYEHYNRESFIETLDDWGFFGDPKNKPLWYTQKHWS